MDTSNEPKRPPRGYLEWHEWAKAQMDAGEKQKQCATCNLWIFPAEIPFHKCKTQPNDLVYFLEWYNADDGTWVKQTQLETKDENEAREIVKALRVGPTLWRIVTYKIIASEFYAEDFQAAPFTYKESPVHAWFELSYAQYLTIPRLVMQSMSHEWQAKMVALLEELDATFDWRPAEGRYWVTLRKDNGHFTQAPLSDYRHGTCEHLRKKE